MIAMLPWLALLIYLWWLTKVDRCGRVSPVNRTGSADRHAAIRRQELRRSNAAQPIPQATHKRPRSRAKQDLRQEYR